MMECRKDQMLVNLKIPVVVDDALRCRMEQLLVLLYLVYK
jgi:hypothetical protein